MTQALGALADRVAGTVIRPDDEGYDEARRVYNAMIDARPAAIVRCATDEDVVAVVRLAAEKRMDLAVRGGGHSVPGFGTADGAIVADLSGMQSVEVDDGRRTAAAGGGTTWGRFNDVTAAHGLATTGGIISTTGHRRADPRRRHRLSLPGARALLRQPGLGARGDRRRRAGHRQRGREPRPVLGAARRRWQLRRRHGVHLPAAPGRPPSTAARCSSSCPTAPAVIKYFRRLHRDGAPRVRRLPGLPDRPAAAVRAGEPGRASRSSRSSRAGPARRRRAGGSSTASARSSAPVAEHIGPMPYPALNSAFDGLVPPGLQHYWKAAYVKELTDEAIAVHMEHGAQGADRELDGAPLPDRRCGAGRPGRRDGVRPPRRELRSPSSPACGPTRPTTSATSHWVRDYYAAIAPHSEAGGYVNFASPDDQDKVAGQLRRQLPPAGRGQAALRPRQPLPPEPEHPAGACAFTAGQHVLRGRRA